MEDKFKTVGYQVTKSYFDGDHDHGSYESPVFATRELAEAFRDKVWGDEVIDENIWWTDCVCFDDTEAPCISEIRVWTRLPTDKETPSKNWLFITYT